MALANSRAYKPYSLLPAETSAEQVRRCAAAECGVQVHEIEDVYPCTPLQAGFMVSTTKIPEAYVCTYSYAVLQMTDVDRLRYACSKLKAAESVLRNSIFWHPPTSMFFQVTLAHHDCNWSKDWFDSPITLGRDLCRVNLSKEDETQRWVLNLKIHHSIFDGHAMQLMLQRLKLLYDHGDRFDPGLPFTAFVQHLVLDDLHQDKEHDIFWRDYLGSASAFDYPRTILDPAHQIMTSPTKSSSFTIDINRLAVPYSSSPATILYAAMALVLGAHSGTEDVIFGLTLSGRSVLVGDIDSMIGPTITTLPFRTTLNKRLSITEYLQQVQQAVLNLTSHQHYGLQKIKRAGPEAAKACDFRTLVVVQPADQTAGDGALFEKIGSSDNYFSDIPLTLEFILENHHIRVECAYDAAYIPEHELDVLLSHLGCVLQAFHTLTPSSKLAGVRLASHYELSRIHEWATEDLTAVRQPKNDASSDCSPRERKAFCGEIQWVLERDDEGGLRPAPLLCPGEIASPVNQSYLEQPLSSKSHSSAPRVRINGTTSQIHLTGNIGFYDLTGRVHRVSRPCRNMMIDDTAVDPMESERHLRVLGGPFANAIVEYVVDGHRIPHLAAFVDVCHQSGSTYLELVAVDEFDSSFKLKCLKAQQQLFGSIIQPYIPKLFIPMSYLPTTATGEPDRTLLREAFENAKGGNRSFLIGDEATDPLGQIPQTEAEIKIEAAFQEVFDINARLTTIDDFFQLGGDSFVAINLVAAARKRGNDISVGDIYQHPRLGDLAKFARSCAESENIKSNFASRAIADRAQRLLPQAARLCNIPTDQIENIYPASPFQENLAAEMRIAPKSRLNGLEQSTVPRNIFGEGKPLLYYQFKNSESEHNSRLLLFIHHVLYDGWTLAQLLDDLNTNCLHYQVEIGGREPYAHFIDHIKTTNTTENAKYWASQMANMRMVHFPPMRSHNYEFQATEVSTHKEVLELKHSREQGIMPAALVMAAWGLLLSSYCNTDDVCFGTVLSGRDEAFLQNVMGPTVASVPMRVIVESSREVHDFLMSTQNTLLHMQKHQHYGIDNISRIVHDSTHEALKFSSMLVIQREISGGSGTIKALVEIVDEETNFLAEYPLVINASISSTTNQLYLKAEYDSRYIAILEVQRLLCQLGNIAKQLAFVRGLVGQVESSTSNDKANILQWNPLPRPRSQALVHHLFEETVANQPQNIAIDSAFADSTLYKRMTYQQLDAYASRLASHIMNGEHSSLPIAIYLRKSPLVVVSVLAVMKAGRAFVLFDHSTPIARIRSILDDLGQNVQVIGEQNQTDQLQTSNTILLDNGSATIIWNRIGQSPLNLSFGDDTKCLSTKPTSTTPKAMLESTAFILHTSGSTGRPKGIIVSHGASTTALTSIISKLNITSQTRMLALSSYSFDASVMEILSPLITGGCLCMVPDSERLGGGMARALKDLNVNLFFTTPTLASFLESEDVSHLNTLILIGERMTKSFVERWRSGNPHLKIANGYGPSETGFLCSLNANVDVNELDNVGFPIGCHLFIADLFNPNRLAAIGVIGELVVCGENVADGYVNNQEATSMAFGVDTSLIPYPHCEPVRYYRTGDLGKYCPDGSICYIGRKDLQKKIHGQRLELSEIEAQISSCTAFQRVVVELFGSSTLVAFLEVEHTPGSYTGLLPLATLPPKLLQKLDSSLRSALPTYMVPSAYVPVPHFPATTSGKTDRRVLRAAVEQNVGDYRPGKVASKRQPENEKEALMKQMWSEAIPIALEEIGIDDSFFTLGGTSVGVIRLVQHARKRGAGLDVSAVYKSRTLRIMAATLKTSELAEIINNAPQPFSLLGDAGKERCITFASSRCNVPRASILNIYPCSYMPESMMIFAEKHPGSYFIQSVFRLPQDVNIPKLASCLEAVWRRYDLLRTRIVLDDNFRSLQVVIDEAPELLIINDCPDSYLSRVSPPGYGERLTKFAILASDAEKYFVLSEHHAVFDAWSLDMLVQEIKKGYAGKPSDPVDMEHFSTFIQHTLQIQSSSGAAQYWQDTLSDSSVTRLPQVRKSMSKVDQEYRTTIDLPKNVSASLAVLVEAAWGLLLGRYTDSEEVCFGVVRSGRTASVVGIETVIGPTLTSIPRRLRPRGDLSVGSYIADVELATAEALPWEHYGLQNIRKLSDSAKEACAFQTMIVVQTHAADIVEDKETSLALDMLDQESAWSDDCLTLECRPESGGKLAVSLSYDETVMSRDEVQWMVYYFCRLLLLLTSNGDSLIETLDMSGPKTIQQTHYWNEGPLPKTNRRIEEVFQERMHGWSTLPAISAVDAKLTYRELDDLSSYLASCLTASGMRTGDLVPLCLEKTAVMIVAILGVLKAGGAYVPLEIDHPLERMRSVAHEVESRLVLCTPRQEQLCRGMEPPLAVVNIDVLRRQCFEPPKMAEMKQPALSVVKGDTASDIAYVIYTSGSSGKPKGVMIEHAAVSTTILERVQLTDHGPGVRAILYSSYCFDSSVWEMYAPLLQGACLFIPSNDQRLATLPEYLNEHRIEMFTSTPTVVQNILQSPTHCPYLTTLDLGGEAMTKHIIQEWSGNVRLLNAYGPTEACISACCNFNISLDTDPNNIGYATGESTHLWIVEPTNHSKLAPIGCVGELLISGPSLARGYLKDEAKTSKAFIDCSGYGWAKAGDERCYATGDLVRRNGDGSITFAGRKDMQIQLHGIRIEVEEIENVLANCRGIKLAVVEKMIQGSSKFEFLVAFLTLEGRSSQHSQETLLRPDETVRSLINDAASKAVGCLPKYMIPTAYIPVYEIPLSTAGKIDRKALHRIYTNAPRNLLAAYRSHSLKKRKPRTEIQRSLGNIWAQVLSIDVEDVGLDDDFMNLGGNSMAAIKLVSATKDKGLELSVATIFKEPVLEIMAANIVIKLKDRSVSESNDPAALSLLSDQAILPGLFEDLFPASSVQTSYITRAQKWYSHYYFWFFINIGSHITPRGIRDACTVVVRRHQILRSVFHIIGRQCYQAVLKQHVKSDFRLMSCSGRIDDRCCQLIDEDVTTPVQLGQPLTRFRLVIDIETGQQRLGIGLSHAQYDGFCIETIFSDILKACTGKLNKRKPPSYSRYLKYSQQISQSTEARNFWAQMLQGSKMTSVGRLPQSRDAPPDRNVMRKEVSISKQPKGMTVAVVVKTAWSLVLSRLSKSLDIVFGAIVSGRHASFDGAGEVVGPCLNTIPVRLRIEPDETFMDLMKQTYEQQIAMIPYEATPVEQIFRQSPWPSSTRFGSVVLHQDIPRTNVSQDNNSEGLKWRYAGAAAYNHIMLDTTDCWLTTMPDDKGPMTCWLTFNEDTISETTANAIIDYFLAVIEIMTEHPDHQIKTLGTLQSDPRIDEASHSPLDLHTSTTTSNHKLVPHLPPVSDALYNRLRILWAATLEPTPGSPLHTTKDNSNTHITNRPHQRDEDLSFFNLGGTSLAAAHLATMCAEEGLSLELQDIYDFPTLTEQCQVVEGMRERVSRERPRLVFVAEREWWEGAG